MINRPEISAIILSRRAWYTGQISCVKTDVYRFWILRGRMTNFRNFGILYLLKDLMKCAEISIFRVWKCAKKIRIDHFEKLYPHMIQFPLFCAWKHSKYCERIVNKIKEKQMPAVLNYAAWSWQQFWLEMKLRKMFQKTHQGTIILTVKTLKILKPSICQNKIPPNAQKHNFFRVKMMTISRWNLREKNAPKKWKDLNLQPS